MSQETICSKCGREGAACNEEGVKVCIGGCPSKDDPVVRIELALRHLREYGRWHYRPLDATEESDRLVKEAREMADKLSYRLGGIQLDMQLHFFIIRSILNSPVQKPVEKSEEPKDQTGKEWLESLMEIEPRTINGHPEREEKP